MSSKLNKIKNINNINDTEYYIYIPQSKKSNKKCPNNYINKHVNKYNSKNQYYYSNISNDNDIYNYLTNSDIYYEKKC